MANTQPGETFRRLRSRYRLVLMNEDTYEEVIRFKLTRLSVYVAFCSIFVLMIALTTALIIFTPLKYYLPGVGFGNARAVREYRNLKMRTDSMERTLKYQQKYVDDIQKVLKGQVSSLDTNLLTIPQEEVMEE
jgi:hypothetical protein